MFFAIWAKGCQTPSLATSTVMSGPVLAGSEKDTTEYILFTPDGDLIGKTHLPEVCANLRFGGVKRNRIFMTGSSRFTPSSLRHKEPRYHTLTRSLAEEELYL